MRSAQVSLSRDVEIQERKNEKCAVNKQTVKFDFSV